MLQEIVKTGGGSFLIFGVVFALGFYAVRGVFGLHGRRGQHRKEFLELWSDGRERDALWLQVAVRHVFGAYLPTPVIRLALARPDSSQSLLDVSTLWDLFDYDSVSQKVSWRRAWHASSARRRFARAALMAGYFAAMFAAVASAYVSSVYGPGSVLGWVYGVFAAIAAMLGYLCLDRGDMLAVSVRVGDAWMNRINRAARRARTRQLRKSA
jgi:hypothetical protein